MLNLLSGGVVSQERGIKELGNRGYAGRKRGARSGLSG